MRFASIDIGTNTVLLLIAEADSSGHLHTLFEKQRIIRLGKNVDAQKNIAHEGMDKLTHVLTEYLQDAANHQTAKIVIGATSAMRDAANKETILNEIYHRTGQRIQILTGDEEAQWTFQGGCLALPPLTRHPILLIDIGGGGTEFVVGSASDMTFKKSLNIGAVRMTERFINHDPPLQSELESLRRYAHNEFDTHLSGIKNIQPAHALGVAGTVTTLCAMLQALPHYDPKRINGYMIDKAALDSLIEKLSDLTLEERRKIPGLEPERADVIIAGATILSEIFSFFNLDKITVSNFGLRYGLILRELANHGQ
ncbi:MAG TPA: Ppx/GppA phosphatase family protein [bacterium]|nr:Ppx/GppA phosphatase family protein [bacterium]